MSTPRTANMVYVVDGSFFPSSGAVNPSLTIIANALRVGDTCSRAYVERERGERLIRSRLV